MQVNVLRHHQYEPRGEDDRSEISGGTMACSLCGGLYCCLIYDLGLSILTL